MTTTMYLGRSGMYIRQYTNRLINIYGDHCQAKIGVSNNRDGTKMILTLLQCLQLNSDINWIIVHQQS